MELKIDNDQIKALVAEGVLAQLDKDGRDTVIKQAIEFLLTPPPSDRYAYGTKPKAPLTEAYERAVNLSAQDIVRDLVREDTAFQAAIHDSVTDVLAKAMEDSYSFKEVVTSALARALVDLHYDKEN
ncbi:hypothetical protein GTQ99_00430 [Kineococcus sp. T13]|uniref:hypothetical protein n=1 Tax=Kineococcus vitellinus TaxID=2696565 RepID=UPI0014126512|nr:hypothetical protein [Kineococcus vitellinus]NAZ73897.1 hypothetical protein [Kineococcus vitellinus]